MKNIILFDKSILSKQGEIDIAMEGIRADYLDVTSMEWEYLEMDFSSLRWVDYLVGYKGIAWDIVQKDCRDIKTRDGYKYDNVIYVIDEANWQAPNVGGWSLGTPIESYTVQIVRLTGGADWLKKVFAMEIAHSWDDMAIQEIGDSLLSVFGVNSFDLEVIHGAHKLYGVNVPDNPSLNAYYTDYNYRPMILIAQDQIKRMYEVRRGKYIQQTTQFMFGINLRFGMRNNDVVELQKRLRTEGVFTYPTNTGFFGGVTLSSVKSYQSKYGISPTGFVGTITRAKLNSTISAIPEPFLQAGHNHAHI